MLTKHLTRGILTLWLLCQASFCLSLTVNLDNEFDYAVLGPGIEIKSGPVDVETQLQPEQALLAPRWITSNDPSLSFGFTSDLYWVRFQLQNSLPDTRSLIIQTSFPFLDRIDYYILDQSNTVIAQYKVGDSLPTSSRPIEHSHFLVPVTIEAGQTLSVLMRIENDGITQIPITVWDHDRFVEYDYKRSMLFFGFYGLLISIALYHLILFFSLREKTFLYYAGFVGSMLLSYICLEGLPAIFIRDVPDITDQIILFGILSGAFFGGLFTINVLNLQNDRPELAKISHWFVYGSVLIALLTLFLPNNISLAVVLANAIISSLVFFIIDLIRVIDRYPPAKYVIATGPVYCLGVTITIMAKLDVIPSTAITEAGGYAGATFMVMVFALAISYRMNIDRQLREQAQLQLTLELDQLVKDRTIELVKANAKLVEVSVTDSLTGLFNRRYFDEELEREFAQASRDKISISLLVMDIDNFKQINDQYGHHFGDLCLQKVSETLRQFIRRPKDVLARYGGEEFVILLLNTHQQGTLQLAEQIRVAIAGLTIADTKHSTGITISIGVASVTPGNGETLEELFQQADRCLYEAKDNGRNQVVHYPSDHAISQQESSV